MNISTIPIRTTWKCYHNRNIFSWAIQRYSTRDSSNMSFVHRCMQIFSLLSKHTLYSIKYNQLLLLSVRSCTRRNMCLCCVVCTVQCSLWQLPTICVMCCSILLFSPFKQLESLNISNWIALSLNTCYCCCSCYIIMLSVFFCSVRTNASNKEFSNPLNWL